MFFLQAFFHIFTISNELSGFSINRLENMEDLFNWHCTKVSKYRFISGLYFPVFGLNTERHVASRVSVGNFRIKQKKANPNP